MVVTLHRTEWDGNQNAVIMSAQPLEMYMKWCIFSYVDQNLANFSCWVTGSTVRQEHAKDSSWNRPLSCLTTRRAGRLETMDRLIYHRVKRKFQICFLQTMPQCQTFSAISKNRTPSVANDYFFLPVQISSTCKDIKPRGEKVSHHLPEILLCGVSDERHPVLGEPMKHWLLAFLGWNFVALSVPSPPVDLFIESKVPEPRRILQSQPPLWWERRNSICSKFYGLKWFETKKPQKKHPHHLPLFPWEVSLLRLGFCWGFPAHRFSPSSEVPLKVKLRGFGSLASLFLCWWNCQTYRTTYLSCSSASLKTHKRA